MGVPGLRRPGQGQRRGVGLVQLRRRDGRAQPRGQVGIPQQPAAPGGGGDGADLTPQQKAVVALAAIKGERSIAEISGLHEVHSTQIKNWKQYAQDNLPALFADKRTKEGKTQERLIDDLYRIIGKREAEAGAVAVNVRGAGKEQKPNAIPVGEFVRRVTDECRTRSLVLAAGS